MRSLRILLCSLALCLGIYASGENSLPDSTKLAALSNKLEEYFSALKGESLEVQSKEMDFIIDACKDSLVRQYVAIKIYDHYITSKVMGDEGVAVYLTDNWFVPGKVKMKSDIDLMNARIFADFNRQSLIGCKSQQMKVQNAKGDSIQLFANPSGRYALLYFYDVDCSKCKLETPSLAQVLAKDDSQMDVYPFYTGDKKEAWNKYVKDHFSFHTENTVLNNVWDASFDSDFQRKYGVLQTPRMFLVDPDGVIIGRGLDSPVLAQMLDKVADEDNYEYGNESSIQLYSRIFVSLGENYGVDDLRSLVDHIAERTSGDNQTFRETMGDLFYYLSYQQDGRCKEAEKYLCDNYILSRPDIWAGPSDSLKVVGFAKTMSDLLSRSMPGSHVPNVSVRGVYGRGSFSEDSKFSAKRYRLDKLRGSDTYVMFYYRGCSLCKEYMEAAGDLLSSGRKILFVSVSANEQPNLEELLDKFDLTSLPFVLRIG